LFRTHQLATNKEENFGASRLKEGNRSLSREKSDKTSYAEAVRP